MPDDSKKTVILIRHARIDANSAGIYAGRRTDVPLCEEGRTACVAEAERFHKIAEGAVVFAGPMKRVKETAKLLFDDQSSPEASDIMIEDELTEIDFGDFEGRSYDELKNDPRFDAWVASGGKMTFPGGESVANFCARSMRGLHNILERSKDANTVAVVCHGGNIMAIMSILTGKEYFDFKVGNLEGFKINLTFDGKRISDITYDRIDSGHIA